jgi:spermidine synthase
MAIAGLSAIVLFASLAWRRAPVDRAADETAWHLGSPGGVLAVAALVLAIFLGSRVPKVPDGLVAYGRFLPTYTTEPNYLYVGEGMNSSIAVSELANGVRNFHVAGKIEASSEPQDMRLQRMLGHISALLHPNPKSVLVVGFGAGVTAGSFVLHPEVKRIVICEIEPLIPEVVSQYFRNENYNVVNDPRVEIVYDDARHFILTTKEKFDVITSDPIHPWVKGAATLYTKEYFDLVKKHLNPGGIVTQWVPLYESHLDVVKSEFATFFNVFPTGTVWSNDINGKGYDVVLAGRADPMRIDVDAMQTRLDKSDHGRIAQSLGEVGFSSAVALMSTFAGQAPDLTSWLKGAEINTDRNLRLQYLAGFGLNTYENASIYDNMLAFRRYPEQLFVASQPSELLLREALAPPGSY